LDIHVSNSERFDDEQVWHRARSHRSECFGHETWRNVFGSLKQSQDGPTQQLIGAESTFGCGANATMVMRGSSIYGNYPAMRRSQDAIAAIATAIGKVTSSFALPQCGYVIKD
jgi:hypothetical protein